MPHTDPLDALPVDLYEITRLIAGVEPKGSFATRFTLPEDDLEIAVEGAGQIPLPVLAATTRKLQKIAQPARYGLKDQTLLDPTVRDTWEIPGDRVTISRQWRPILDKTLARIRRDLGLPLGCDLEARLHNLLVYSTGQFFATHQDSEKEDGMIGTLVVGLPSRFKGGEFVIRHHDESLVSTGSASELSVVAFYADCRHEIRPITSGHRVVLTWNLIVRKAAVQDAPSAARIDVLAERMRSWFEAPRAPRWAEDRHAAPPDRFVYLLDHEYTQHGLDWDRLKNADVLRAATLREVAKRLDCEIYLALADVHETWSCQDDYSGYGRHGRYRGFDDEDDLDDDDFDDDDENYVDRDEEDYELLERIDGGIELRYWVAPGSRAVKRVSVDVHDREVCYTKPSIDCEPFESEHEGFTGNAGNTVDYWYHRAAIVMWPRAHDFVIRAKSSARWAIDEITRILASDGRDKAREQARRILQFWPDVVTRTGWGAEADAETDTEADTETSVITGEGANDHPEQRERSALLTATLPLVTRLDEAALSDIGNALLAPFRLVDLSRDAVPHFVELLDTHGLISVRAVLDAWQAKPRHHEPGESIHAWLSTTLSTLIRALCARTNGDLPAAGRVLAAEILANRWACLRQRIETVDRFDNADLTAQQLSRYGEPLLALIESAVIADQPALRDTILGFVDKNLDADLADAVPLQLPLAVLRAADRNHTADPTSRDTWRDLGLEPLRQRLTQALSARLARPARDDDDWSIHTPIRCTCELCKTLTDFLRSPRNKRLDWPLAEQRRAHVHGAIDAHGLPVRHVTRRQGRPFTLVLEKTRALFDQDAAARRSWAHDLAWIEALQ